MEREFSFIYLENDMILYTSEEKYSAMRRVIQYHDDYSFSGISIDSHGYSDGMFWSYGIKALIIHDDNLDN